MYKISNSAKTSSLFTLLLEDKNQGHYSKQTFPYQRENNPKGLEYVSPCHSPFHRNSSYVKVEFCYLLIDNGYPEDVLVSCIKETLANISSEKQFRPEKCPAYLKLPWIGNVSSKFEK